MPSGPYAASTIFVTLSSPLTRSSYLITFVSRTTSDMVVVVVDSLLFGTKKDTANQFNQSIQSINRA
eukprot:m.4097 g.4097  ORF g.4097 m.4097 type:complete len:67 (+) comp2168_c0_seq1:1286-1486(+)